MMLNARMRNATTATKLTKPFSNTMESVLAALGRASAKSGGGPVRPSPLAYG
jgi:hypothetical protein